jgi:hypothetical protein
MKKFVTLASRKIVRFFWSWGFLKFVLVVATLVVLLYAEEDWRGARAWAATKAKWEARGETFDFKKLLSPRIPDDQNLAALPFFKMEPDPENHGVLAPLALNRALRWDWEKVDFPNVGNWQLGHFANEGKNRKLIATAYAEAVKTPASSIATLAQFDALCPAINELTAASTRRPYCRFDEIFNSYLPFDINLGLATAQIKTSKFLTVHAVVALDEKKSDVALGDIQTNLKLISGLQQQPLLVSGLVCIGMVSINGSAIYQGLSDHAWNEGQLSDLEDQLSRIDFLDNYSRALRGEACLGIASYDLLKPHRSKLAAQLNPDSRATSSEERSDSSPLFWPDGWIDLLKVRAANFDLQAAHLADFQERVISPVRVGRFMDEIESNAHRWLNSFSMWTILSGEAAGPITSAARKFAYGQMTIDEARIACGLERYRLVHGVYPTALDVLAPSFIGVLPHDVINGEPYRYRLNADGTYLLYSVGWNQSDDGGKIVLKKDAETSIDYTKGDWVWPTPVYPTR